jgi:Uncharacterized conserved protein
MEVYFKDLISKDASLEKLVDDLSRVVQGADDYARAVGANVSEETRNEVVGRLNRLKQNCAALKSHAVTGARATDRLVRANPYKSLALVFAAGFLAGAFFLRRK